jgi:hypothetical protein
MYKRCAVLVAVWVLAAGPWVSGPRTARAAALPPLANLAPGTDLRLQQDVDVNVVLVGFNGIVDPAALLAQPQIPSWNGVPQANGSGQTFIGQRFDFHYHVTMTPPWFENLLFPFLRSVAFKQEPIPIIDGMPPMPITPFQALYNFCNVDPTFDPTLGCSFDPAAPRVNKRFITQNYLLDASFVEKVLSQNIPPLLGLDVTKPTVVLMNWYGRPDYVDHIYLDPSEPDPETGVQRGLYFSNELAGYGATSDTDPETCQGDCVFHRLWFYDVSAGPMGRTGGSDLVAPIQRFGFGGIAGGPNYRFHHIADYGTVAGAYRPITTLLPDLARLVGAVFVSELAYGAPLYPPGLTPPLQPHHLVLDVNRWNWSGDNLAAQLDVPRMIGKMNALPYTFGANVTDQPDGPDSRLGQIWQCSLTSGLGFQLGQSCYGNRYGGFALSDLQAYFVSHQNQFLTGAPDYEVPIFEFNVPPALASPLFAGMAASNYGPAPSFQPTVLPDERQSFVFTSTTPDSNAFEGHGVLLEHEVGHHLGFSHPFNGYRCLTETCGPGAFIPFAGNPLTWFTKAGNYASGLMTYVSVNNDYSRFELDNLQRWLTWQYLDLSNFVVGQISNSPQAGSVTAAVLQGDTRAGVAIAEYRNYQYADAVEQARAAYDGLVAAAGAIHVQLSPQAYQAVRRNPMNFNQALRDYVASTIVDNKAEMSGEISTAGVHGLEGRTFPPSTTKLAEKLPHPASTTLR